jgi:hypothetical protein
VDPAELVQAVVMALGRKKATTVMEKDHLQAVDLALAGNWEAAHKIVQQHETDPTAAWIHAVLHKIEGDPGNSRYWYRRAGKLEHVSDEPTAELTEIRKEIAAQA